VIADYLATALKEMGGVWQSELSYEQKILATVELNRARYLRFNPPRSRGGAAWSLISRMRLDAGLLSEAACSRLRDFSRQIESYVQATIERAKADGDLAGTAPTRDIVVQIVSIIDSAGPITQDGGSFDRLEHLYLACMRVIAHAYGSHRKLRGRSVTRDGERIGVALSR
jgi:TetR/AcrR family transcriptional repressor of nem operon